MQPTEFEIAGRPAQWGAPTVMKAQYQYYPDGSLKYAKDLMDGRFDRAFSYDHVSMLKEAYTDAEARDFLNGTSGGPANGPYRQSYRHDAFGHMTQKDSRFWSHSANITASYSNNRRQGFTYDAEGRLILDSDLQYDHDAAGRNWSIRSAGQNRTINASHDGDGEVVKRTVSQESSTVTYYLRSRVLGGKIVNELNHSGLKQKGYVYAGQELLAEQVFTSVVWQHESLMTGSRGVSYANGYYVLEGERDATGVDVGLANPFLTFPAEPSTESYIPTLFSDGPGCSGNPNCVTCSFDGMKMANCDLAFSQLANGAAEIDPRDTSPSAAGSLGATPIYGRFCVERVSMGRIEMDCEVEITGYTSSGLLSTSLNLRPLEPQNTTVGPDDLKAYKARIDEMLKDKACREFLQQLFNGAKAITGRSFTGILDTFDQIKFSWKDELPWHGGHAYFERGSPVADIDNTVKTEKFISADRSAFLISSTTQSFLAETLHHVGVGMYGDGVMAQALNHILVSQGKAKPQTFDLRDLDEKAVGDASRYWHPKVWDYCRAPRK